jgi:phosphoglycolate phosphatase-like HAD superfamily hydrolase
MHLVLFDIDGTLIRGHGLGRKALELAFAEIFGIRVEEHPELRNVPFAGQTDPTIHAGMAAVLDIPDTRFRARLSDFEVAYCRHLRVTVAASSDKEPCPGIVELLPRLHRHPVVLLGLLTGNIEKGARIKLDPFGLNAYFPFGGFGSDHEDRAVLAAKAWEIGRARAGKPIPPEHVLVVGDTEHDVMAGKRNGFLTAGVTTGFGSGEAMRRAGADAVFDDLTPAHGFEAWLRERWDLDWVAVLEGEV